MSENMNALEGAAPQPGDAERRSKIALMLMRAVDAGTTDLHKDCGWLLTKWIDATHDFEAVQSELAESRAEIMWLQDARSIAARVAIVEERNRLERERDDKIGEIARLKSALAEKEAALADIVAESASRLTRGSIFKAALAESQAELAEYRKASVAAYDKLDAELDAARATINAMVLKHQARLRSATATATGEDDLVRIWSGEHNAYWRPNAQGYTVRAAAAWLLPRDEAVSRTSHCGPEKMIDIQEASDIAAAHAQSERAGIEKAAKVADSFTCGGCGMDGKSGAAIRALAAPEPQEEKL